MTDTQQREATRELYFKWRGKGREVEDVRSYWIKVLSDVLGVENVTQRLGFEKRFSAAMETPSGSMYTSRRLSFDLPWVFFEERRVIKNEN